MSGFAGWKPWEIERLTPLQLLCVASEDPPGRFAVRSMADMEAVERNEPDWDEGRA